MVPLGYAVVHSLKGNFSSSPHSDRTQRVVAMASSLWKKKSLCAEQDLLQAKGWVNLISRDTDWV